MDSPLTVLASLDVESRALDLNIVFPFRKCGKIAVELSILGEALTSAIRGNPYLLSTMKPINKLKLDTSNPVTKSRSNQSLSITL